MTTAAESGERRADSGPREAVGADRVHPRSVGWCLGSLLVLCAPATLHAAEKAPRPPKITAPILFDTPQADQLLATMRICPASSPWHEDISKRPLHPDS